MPITINSVGRNCAYRTRFRLRFEKGIDSVSKANRVLVIEDDELTLEAMKRSLEAFGFETFTASDGVKGLKLANDIKPSFILLDWMMPEMDGMEVPTRLKGNKKTKKTPVFMLTARGTIADLDEVFEIGVDDYITKPSDLTLLGKTVLDKWEKFTS